MPIHTAAIHGQLGSARFLVARGANVNAACLDNVRPLHYAAGQGHLEMAAFLLDQGAEIDALDGSHSATPLAWAHFQKKPAVMEFLQSRGGRLRV
jgi:ankyrin repeat protein